MKMARDFTAGHAGILYFNSFNSLGKYLYSTTSCVLSLDKLNNFVFVATVPSTVGIVEKDVMQRCNAYLYCV